MTKVWQKKPCFFIFSFFLHLCIQQYTRTTVINNKQYSRPGGPAYPLNLIFSNQFKRITRVKSRIFVRKLLFQALILTFYERNAITSAVFAKWLSARDRPSDGKTFFGLHLYLAGRCSKNSLYCRKQCKSSPGITCLASVTIYCTNDSPRQFLREKILLKKKLGKMLIEQIIEIELRAWAPWPYMYSCNWLTSWQNKNL